MTDAETITVADARDGPGSAAEDPGTPVSLPAVELLTGRGFITGKSGSGKSNTASVVIENLLSNGFPVLIVDTDGEYYGLKESFEILHAGADDECDIQVNPEHAEKLATLALEENVPIILDVSGYLDEEEAKDLLRGTARHLFAKEKKMKKPFLLLVEECHEYIPEGGGLDETGKMLIKVGKRGRKHGLGIVGISQRPANVKKDFITQCDWLVWHRLTWRNDTKVVGRILGSEYADAVEELDDGEGFLVTDWGDAVRRVQFHRKETFDAGATPGLDDFERPELKSVSGDLVDELRDISEERERRESELADLRQELDRKEQRIRELEAELEDARDLSRMADRFAQALLAKAEAPYRGGRGRNPNRAEPADGESAPAAEAGDDVDGSANDGGPAGAADPGPTGDDHDSPTPEPSTGTGNTPDSSTGHEDRGDHGRREGVVRRLASRVDELDDVARGMLAHYRRQGADEPVDAHLAAGGSGDRNLAYDRNRALRRAGLVRHVGRGRYAYALPELVREEFGDGLHADDASEIVAEIESAVLDVREEDRGDSPGGSTGDGPDAGVDVGDAWT